MSVRSLSQTGNLFKKILLLFDRGYVYLSVISASAVVMAMFATLADVVGRLLKMPILGVHEFNALLIGICVYLAIGFVQRKKRNITVTLLTDRVSTRAAAILDVFMLIICAVFFAWTSRLYYEAAKSSFLIREVAEGISGFPIYPLKYVMFVGVVILTIQLVVDIISRVLQAFNVPAPKEPKADEVKGEVHV